MQLKMWSIMLPSCKTTFAKSQILHPNFIKKDMGAVVTYVEPTYGGDDRLGLDTLLICNNQYFGQMRG